MTLSGSSSCGDLFLITSDQVYFNFNLQLIPRQYSVPSTVNGKVILYRGDRIGLENTGIPSKALVAGDILAIRRAKEMFESTNVQKMTLAIDSHSNGYSKSPFVSATFNPRLAQMFALNSHRGIKAKSPKTIYRMEIDLSRVIFDFQDIGGAGSSGEVLILGGVRPEEITAVKIVNDDISSELFDGRYIRSRPDANDMNRTVRDPANWRKITNGHRSLR